MASRFVKRWLPKQTQEQEPVGLNEDIIRPVPQIDSYLNPESKEGLKNGSVEIGEEKVEPGSGTSGDDSSSALDDDDPAIRDIPFNVRRIVSFDDDPTLPTLTFRYFFLTVLFVIPGAFLSQMSHYRTNYAPYSVFFVQICANYAGQGMAKYLPAWQINIPFTSRGFNLNPGPFSVKEHVLITISAASGATYNLAFTPVSIASLFFNETINPAIAIFFMWSVVVTGYSFAAISRQFLLYDPQYPWFQA